MTKNTEAVTAGSGKEKHMVIFAPVKGTPWKGTFTLLTIDPSKYEGRGFKGSEVIPRELKRVLSPGDGLVLSDEVYEYYTNEDTSTALSDRIIIHRLLKPGDEFYANEHGDIVRGAMKVDATYSIPADPPEEPTPAK